MQQWIRILLFYIYLKLNMFRVTHLLSLGAKLHKQPLVLHNTMEGCWTCSWWTLSTNYTSNNLPRIKKPEATSAILGS